MSQAPTHGFGCAICSDTFRVNAQHNICTLRHCGHVYHECCLKRWFRTQIEQGIPSSCPKCRAAATETQMIRLFLHQTISDDNDVTDVAGKDKNRGEDNQLRSSLLSAIFRSGEPDVDFGAVLVVESDVESDNELAVGSDVDDGTVPLEAVIRQVPLPTQAPTNANPSHDTNSQQEQTLSEDYDDNDLFNTPAFAYWDTPGYDRYESFGNHANSLHSLDERLRLLNSDISAMTDMVNGLESYMEAFH